MDFSYEIKNGITELESSAGVLYVVKRSLGITAPGNYAYNAYAHSSKNGGNNIVSIVYRPNHLGQLRQWHEIPKTNPNVLVKKLHDAVLSPYGCNPKEASLLMSRLALCAAGDLLQNASEHTMNRFIDLMPAYEDAVMQQSHLHTAALGAVAAHAARQELASR